MNWKNLPKDKQQKLILVCIVTVAAVGLCWQFLISSQLARKSKAHKQIVELTAKIGDAQRDAKSKRIDPSTLADLEEFVNKQRAKMVSGDPFAWIVREITLVSETHPVRVQSVRNGGKAVHPRLPGHEAVTARLEVSGTFDQLGNFVRDLENSFPTAEVRSIQMSGSADGNHQMSIELCLMVQPESFAKKPTEPGRKS